MSDIFCNSTANNQLCLSAQKRRLITSANRNYSPEGILHPDRVMEDYDLLYMLEGSWEIWEEDNCYHVGANQVLLLEPQRHHYSLKKCTPQMRNLYLHFTVLPGDGNDEKENIRLSRLTDCSFHRNILHLMEQTIETYWYRSAQKYEEKLGTMLDLILFELADIHASAQNLSDPLIHEITHLFYSRPERFFSPEELAAVYHISLRTISSRFKKATGQSLHQYQLRLKLNMAYDTLAIYPNRGLRDIALSFGFYDEFQFSKLFKRQFGISPSTRRKS